MKAKRLKIALCFFVILLTNSTSVYSLSVETHKTINETVAKGTMNGFSFDSYLKNNLSLSEGIEEVFDSETVFTWLGLGGKYEDKPPWTIPYARSINHFHDPISNMGYHYGVNLGLSSIDWALKVQSTQIPGGYYSWNDVMGYYKEALTDEDQDTRNTNFAKTFRGIGQLMHHVQDASSPAHTRNDQHLSQDPQKNYEAWVRDNKSTDADISGFTPVFFNGVMDSYSGGLVDSIASFIDTNQYNGTNPNITDGTDIGLSEYTNANFYSEDTINSTNYTYPKITQNTLFDVRDFTNPNINSVNARLYYLKNDSAEGETNGGNGYLLRAVDYLYYYRQSVGILETVTIPLLDYNVYEDYAFLLLPRAIGYSAGLLNYFFRGEIEVIQVPNSNNINIKNKSSEDMDGIFTLYYESTDGNRYPVSDGSWYLSSLQAGVTSNELSFTEPTDIAEDTQYTLVFEGTLGTDSNAVVGKVFSGAGGCDFPIVDTCSVPCSDFLLRCQADDWHKVGFLHRTSDPYYWDVYSWDFGDGEFLVGDVTDAYSFTHTYATAGTYTVSVRVSKSSNVTYKYPIAIDGGGYKTGFSRTQDDPEASNAKAHASHAAASWTDLALSGAQWRLTASKGLFGRTSWSYNSMKTTQRFDLTTIDPESTVELEIGHFQRFDSGWNWPTNGEGYTDLEMLDGMKNDFNDTVITHPNLVLEEIFPGLWLPVEYPQIIATASEMAPLIGTTKDIHFSSNLDYPILTDVMPDVTWPQTDSNIHGWEAFQDTQNIRLKIRTPSEWQKTTKVIKVGSKMTEQVGDPVHEGG